MDEAFIARSTKTAISLTAQDLVTLKYKKEIQHMYKQHMFESFNPSNTLSRLNMHEYNTLVRQLKSDSVENYDLLHNLKLKGIGPAEAAMYLLTSNGHLSGGNSRCLDLVMGSEEYEIKAVKWKSKKTKEYVCDFILGPTMTGLIQIERMLHESCYRAKITKHLSPTNISAACIKLLQERDPKAYELIRTQFKRVVETHFKGRTIVFIQNDRSQDDYGEILAIKPITADDIELERYTLRMLKPLIKV